MSTEINSRKVFRLSEVTASIQKTLQKRYTSAFWVTAEINKLNYYSHSGHCYPELVEKKDAKILAEIRSVIWKEDFAVINDAFQRALRTPLTDGIKVLMLVKVHFHAVSGVQLQVLNIDPTYTLGDLQREKSETLTRLRNENIFDSNKKRPLALLPKRIAVISAQTSKGYSDFKNILDSNPWNYSFFHMLFPAYLQGEKSVASIISKLEELKKVQHHFDVVAIIRGGGGEVGLSSFNNYELAKAIASFPLPVITGIGHATNDTVAEMVSYYNAITPTQSAGFLIQKFHDFSAPLQEARNKIISFSGELCKKQNDNLLRLGSTLQIKTIGSLKAFHQSLDFSQRQVAQNSRYTFKHHSDFLNQLKNITVQNVNHRLAQENLQINTLSTNLHSGCSRYIEAKYSGLDNLENNIRLLDPRNILKRGFSITKHNGHVITSADQINVSDEIETILYNGTIKSTVTKKQ